jgi:hypothetical protein
MTEQPRPWLGVKALLGASALALLVALVVACGDPDNADESRGSSSSLDTSADFGFGSADENTVRLVNQVGALIAEGNLDEATRLIGSHDLTAPDFQLLFFGAAGCNAAAIEHLIEEAQLDPFVERSGETTVYALTWPDFASEEPKCAESDRVAPVQVLLEAGVNPCRPPDGHPEEVPALKAEEWGRSPEMGSILRRYAPACT